MIQIFSAKGRAGKPEAVQEVLADLKIIIADSAQTGYCTTFPCVLVTGVTSQVFSII